MRTSLTRSCSCRSAFRACNASDNRLCRSCACCLYAMFTGQHSMYSTGWWGVNGSCVLLRIIFPTQRNAALPTSSQASIWFSNCELYICRLFCPELKSVLKFDSLLPGWLLLLLIGMLFFSLNSFWVANSQLQSSGQFPSYQHSYTYINQAKRIGPNKSLPAQINANAAA